MTQSLYNLYNGKMSEITYGLFYKNCILLFWVALRGDSLWQCQWSLEMQLSCTVSEPSLQNCNYSCQMSIFYYSCYGKINLTISFFIKFMFDLWWIIGKHYWYSIYLSTILQNKQNIYYESRQETNWIYPE